MKEHRFASWTLTKSAVEEAAGRAITDEEFEGVVSDLEGRMENFYEELYEMVILDLNDGMFARTKEK